jgi:signal peptidase II
MASDKRKYWAFGAAFLLSLLADQASKVWARASLKGHPPLVVVKDYFDFHYSENPGSAFGLFRDVSFMRYVILVIGVVAVGVIVSFLRRARPERLRLAAELGLLAGGALGNLIDRVMYQKVTDFILWKAPMSGWLCGAISKVMGLLGSDLRYCEWPTFNVADAALVVGVIALLFDARADDVQPADKPAARP